MYNDHELRLMKISRWLAASPWHPLQSWRWERHPDFLSDLKLLIGRRPNLRDEGVVTYHSKAAYTSGRRYSPNSPFTWCSWWLTMALTRGRVAWGGERRARENKKMEARREGGGERRRRGRKEIMPTFVTRTLPCLVFLLVSGRDYQERKTNSEDKHWASMHW